MWKPKNENNDIYIGKLARIYHTDGEYREGKLIYIKESLNIKGSYSVCVENIIGYPTWNTVTSNLIERLDIEIFEILEETKKVCSRYMNDDISNVVNDYVNPFISI
jgi:hypothetical protein